MIKAYCVGKFYDNGKTEAIALAEDEITKYPEYMEALENGGYLPQEKYDLYVDKYNSMDEAIAARDEVLCA